MTLQVPVLRSVLPQVPLIWCAILPLLECAAPLLVSCFFMPALLGALVHSGGLRPPLVSSGGTCILTAPETLVHLLPLLFGVPAISLWPALARGRALAHSLRFQPSFLSVVQAVQLGSVLLMLMVIDSPRHGTATNSVALLSLAALQALLCGVALAPVRAGTASNTALYVSHAAISAGGFWWYFCLIALPVAGRVFVLVAIGIGWFALFVGVVLRSLPSTAHLLSFVKPLYRQPLAAGGDGPYVPSDSYDGDAEPLHPTALATTALRGMELVREKTLEGYARSHEEYNKVRFPFTKRAHASCAEGGRGACRE